MIYDIIIIGAGPAGMTAAIYAARKKLSALVLTDLIGGQMIWSTTVDNYTGFHVISGAELTNLFKEHTEQYKINIKDGELVSNIKKDQNHFHVQTKNTTYKSKTIINLVVFYFSFILSIIF